MRYLLIFSFIALVTSCEKSAELKTGTWRGVIALQGKELPFTFDVEKQKDRYTVYLNNVSEELMLDEVTVSGDCVKMVLHIFDADLRAKIEGDKLTGTFYKNYAPEVSLPFSATYGETHRFLNPADTTNPADINSIPNFSGKYQLEFRKEKESYVSVGIFEQTGDHLTGTFLTPMGDYRYLEGDVVDGKLMLSTFDGNHAFLFIAEKSGDSLKGDYYSGKSSHEVFRGIKDENAKMPDPEAQTLLKEGFDKVEFSFPDLDGNMVSPTDERFKDKVLILQIFGTWCPNCMDETKFLSEWYRDNHDRGVEVLGLAYERKPDFNYAAGRVKKMKEKLDVPYDFVIAGVNDKEKAAESLPMLNKVIAFPTTIIIDRDGKVKTIHAGFEGPGTGIYHERFKERFNQIINELLNTSLVLN